MSELDSQYVKRGYWVNHAHGPVMGQAITTDSKTGAIVIALLAVITTLGLDHLWHLLTFFYHQWHADGIAYDGLFRQQQSLLRTLPTPGALLVDSIKLGYAWRGIIKWSLFRSLFQSSVAFLFVAASLAVSIFSSYVVSSVNLEVLINSPLCGPLDPSDDYWGTYLDAVGRDSQSYGPDCYKNGSLPSRCNIFSRPNIPFSMEPASCPFDSNICLSQAIALDSGLVDVNDAFGMNLGDSNRVRYRRRSVCTILPVEGYTRITLNPSVPLGRSPLPSEEFLEYCYHLSTIGNQPLMTFGQSLLEANITHDFSISASRDYVHNDSWGGKLHRAQLIPQLRRKDADVVLKLIRLNSKTFENPVNDPVFSAHREDITYMTDGSNRTIYAPDFPGSVMGCALQMQLCFKSNSASEACTELGGTPELSSKEFQGLSKLHLAIVRLILTAFSEKDLSAVNRIKTEAELSDGGSITRLPDDQWMKELHDWEAITWTEHQIMIADYAIGPTARSPLAQSLMRVPSDEGEKSLCSTQKMRKPGGFVNINYFGLVFTLTMCSFIVFLDLVLLRFLIFLRNAKKAPAPRLDRWIQDGVFQLQRRAYEARGDGVWKSLTKEIPVTIEKTDLPDWQIKTFPIGVSDPKVESGKRPTADFTQTLNNSITTIQDVEPQEAPSVEDGSGSENYPIPPNSSEGRIQETEPLQLPI